MSNSKYNGFFTRCVACNDTLSPEQFKKGLCSECGGVVKRAAYQPYHEKDLYDMTYELWRNPMGRDDFDEDIEKDYNGD